MLGLLPGAGGTQRLPKLVGTEIIFLSSLIAPIFDDLTGPLCSQYEEK